MGGIPDMVEYARKTIKKKPVKPEPPAGGIDTGNPRPKPKEDGQPSLN